MFSKGSQYRISLVSVLLTGVLLIMGTLSLLGRQLPHTQHRPTPSVQAGEICIETVATVNTAPDIDTELSQPASTPAPRIIPHIPTQPLLAEASLQTRAP